jgi:hypothetical protein
MIYLSPTLEQESQEEVDFTVAHEFAQAYLGHNQTVANPESIEDDADALVVSWGFVVPQRRK